MRVGIVGCGMIGALRARSISHVRGADLRVACDADATRARSLADRYHCEMETAWTKAVTREDVDVIVVSTPNDLHAEITLAAMGAGKHVLCEKPLGRTSDECRQMVAAASQHRVRLMTGFNHRQLPPMRKAKELLETGAIGTPLSLRGWIGHEGGPDFLRRWVGNAKVAGGGTLVDNGVHLIDLVRFFLGEVTDVQGCTRTSFWEIQPSEDQALVLLQTQKGPVAFVMATWTEWRGYHLWLQINGSQGVLTCQYPPMLTSLDRKTAKGGTLKRTRFLFPREQVIERILSHQWTTAQSFSRELTELLSAIREDRDVRPSGYDGLRAMEIVSAVYQSAHEGRRISLPVEPRS